MQPSGTIIAILNYAIYENYAAHSATEEFESKLKQNIILH